MTISDVLVAAPWIVFAVALAVICIRLLSSDRASGRQPSERERGPSHPSPAAPDGPSPPDRRSRHRKRGVKPFAVVPSQRARRSRDGQDTDHGSQDTHRDRQDTHREARNADVEAR